jgi:glycine cleavage system regulatory protein
MSMLVLTLIGPDRAGLVELLAQTVTSHSGNWLESRMARLAGKFAGVLQVDVPEERVEALTGALQILSRRGLTVVVEASGDSQVAGTPRLFTLEVVGQDRPGIVREISQVLSQRGVNVEELSTGCESAAMSGESLFRANAQLRLPEGADVDELRGKLEAIATDLMVDLTLCTSPHRNESL